MPELTPMLSTLAEDPDLCELVEMYVDEMPERITQIRETISNKPELLRLVHQIKGAAGSYGFDELSTIAARYESEISLADNPTEIEECVDRFIGQCQRVSTDAP